MSMMKVRRVVTGEPTPGESTFTVVEEVKPLVPFPGFAQYHVWGWDGEPTLPLHDETPYESKSHFPAPGNVRVTANYMGAMEDPRPNPSEDDEHAADAAEFGRVMQLQDVGTKFGEAAGMHRTDTIDIGVVVSGEVTVESTDGSKVTLGPGDVYVQNGAFHAWHGNPENPAHMVFVIVGARREEAGG
jgi:quercetin dioxygenase-like cupin family protein